jgi:hypothetical protein
MVKADSKQKNVRLRFDAWFALEDLRERWGCSRDMALERMILQTHQSLALSLSTPSESLQGRFHPLPSRQSSLPKEVRDMVSTDPASIPGVSQGVAGRGLESVLEIQQETERIVGKTVPRGIRSKGDGKR